VSCGEPTSAVQTWVCVRAQIISSSLVFTDTVSNVDPNDIKFVSVTTTTDYSCGLLWNGVTVCWSFLTDTDLDLSGPGCRMESIASDGYVSCGRLMHGDDELVPSTEQRHSRLDETTVRTHTNTTFFGRSDTGVFCWQSFPDSLIGLERPTETWELDERRVPLGTSLVDAHCSDRHRIHTCVCSARYSPIVGDPVSVHGATAARGKL